MSNDQSYEPLTREAMIKILDTMPRSLTPGDMAKIFAQLLHSYNMIDEAPVIFGATLHVLNYTNDTSDNTVH